MRSLIRWIIVVALVLTACSGTDSTPDPATTEVSTAAPTTIAPTTAPVPAPSTAPPAPTPTVNLLVTLNNAAEVVVMDPDGGNPRTLSEPGDAAFQPIFSPAADRIAYGVVRPTFSLDVADVATGTTISAELTSNPFYLHWAPDGERIASLRNSATGLAFELFDTTGAEPVGVFTDSGSPYYFDWSPDSAELAAHVGIDRLERLSEGLEFTAFEDSPGVFSAPQWEDHGIYASVDRDGQLELVRIAGETDTVALLNGGAIFGVEPSLGNLVAIQTAGDAGNAVEAALGVGASAAQNPPTIPPQKLVVLDRATGTVATVADEFVLAFFWSPYGERLLTLSLAGSGEELQWHVWHNGDRTDGPVFRPPGGWVSEFIQFHEQYARSTSLWSPDGTAYAFPGDIAGENGIWVVEVATGEQSKVADGFWVAWSPR